MIVLRDGEIIGIFEKPFNADAFEWPFDYPFHLICNMAIQIHQQRINSWLLIGSESLKNIINKQSDFCKFQRADHLEV
jgi:hypothetical protein